MSRTFMIRLAVVIASAVVILAGISCSPEPEPERKSFDSPMKKLPPPRREVAPIPTPTPAPTQTAKVAQKKEPANWVFVDSQDRLGLGVVHSAGTESLNTVSFGFPYEGEQRAFIILRSGPRGTSASFNIKKGQILDQHGLLVVFDDGTPQLFEVSEPRDGSSNTVFIDDYDEFYAALTASSRIRVEVSFYQEGTRAFEFDVRDAPANEAP